ncbi:hypothetical protein GCM10009678_17830 [Actinomadura kijaniata]|uniref:5-methyltetrahydropteroyltriglutamate--homocysteine S-methyltransferase n=1 Tax=Actinomadura namibiensis TaxID=182080 RepID=A0A7W3QQX4_ACTNM|nr:methionine synthase II (cobalamin-independent) [Actinomadura namibiensis]
MPVCTFYHYLVPEVGPGVRFRLVDGGDAKPLVEYREARALGVETRPVLVGPLTYLLLAKPAAGAPSGFAPLDLLDDLVEVYAELLERLAGAGAAWVQLDEPALVADRPPAEIAALARVYRRLGDLPSRPRLLVATYFGTVGDAALRALAACRVEAVALDLVAGPGNLEALASVGGLPRKTVVAGVVDGRNVWRTDPRRAKAVCAALLGLAGRVAVSTSCSLLHVPLDLDAETALDPAVRGRLAFARQKVGEVVALGRALHRGEAAPVAGPDVAPPAVDHRVRARLETLADTRRGDRAARLAAQTERLGLPPLATTTIGSFPQTERIRRVRADHRAGRLTDEQHARCARRSPAPSRCRRTSAWTSWCTASPNATTWSSTSPNSSTGTPPPGTAGSSPTGRAACGPRSCTATCPGPAR